ncbi:STAS domain-containing protein [Actinoplanes sp. NPDC026619]|uniref:STAS domain-containing protein n=1 Tax=Actinoplanes sp. NPDC026619 TaxID=3155798 RepID=UPI0033CE37B3
MPIEFEVADHDPDVLASPTGRLTFADVAKLRLSLDKCLAEQPASVLIGLNGLTVDDPLTLTVFLAFSADAARWPGVPVLLCGPTDEVRTMLAAAAFRRLPVFESVAAGREHVRTHRRVRSTLSEQLLPIAGAARHARDVTTEACLRWDLPHLVGPATLIASELVSNAAVHASTIAHLRLTLGERHLTIAVRDGSTQPPVVPDPAAGIAERGNGLKLVSVSALSWGWLPAESGKVVWASLSRRVASSGRAY